MPTRTSRRPPRPGRPEPQFRAEWNNAALKVILATVKEELGLANAAELTADLHSLLVYETNQHFLTHQEQEARITDGTDLEWLAAQWNLRP